MLFAILWKLRTDLPAEQLQQSLPRRAAWKPKSRMVSEYWFVGAQRGEWAGVSIAEVDDPATIYEDLQGWQDLLEMRAHLVVESEQGLRIAQQAMAAAATA